MGKTAEYVGIGYCSNDHLAVVPFIPMDTKVQMKSHAILGGGPAGNSTAAAAALGKMAAFIGTVGDDPDGRTILADFAAQGVDTSAMKVRPGATSAIAYLWIEEKTGNRSCQPGYKGGLPALERTRILSVDRYGTALGER